MHSFLCSHSPVFDLDFSKKSIMQSISLRVFLINGFVVIWWTETTVSGTEDSMETNEAAAALLNMESPNNILDEKRMRKFICMLIIPLLQLVTKTSALI